MYILTFFDLNIEMLCLLHLYQSSKYQHCKIHDNKANILCKNVKNKEWTCGHFSHDYRVSLLSTSLTVSGFKSLKLIGQFYLIVQIRI